MSGHLSGYVRVGIAQWTPWPQAAVNLDTAEAAIRELARRGCRLAVLPELWLCGYRPATLGADARAAAEPIDGPVQRRLAAAARTTGMTVCAGSFPELDGGQLYNTAVIYGPDGDLLLRHRKACLYGSEPAVFQPGSTVATVGEIAGIGRVGLCICFDGDFPETARSLRQAGAGFVLHPSAYETAAQSWWDTIYPAQALCNGQWWISANLHGAADSTGGTDGEQMLGGSRIIAPDGRVVAAAPRHRALVPTPELLVADLAIEDELATAAAAGGLLWSPPLDRPRSTEEQV
jgi:predicted amidohydrolase